MEARQMVCSASGHRTNSSKSTLLSRTDLARFGDADQVFDANEGNTIMVATLARNRSAGLLLLLAVSSLTAGFWLWFTSGPLVSMIGLLGCRLGGSVLLVSAAFVCGRVLIRHIPVGSRALIRNGRRVLQHGTGFLLLPPWCRLTHLVSVRPTAFRTTVNNCRTDDNTSLQLDLMIVFQIDDAPRFVQNLGVSRFNEMLAARLEAGARDLVAETCYRQAHRLRGKSAGELLAALNEDFLDFGVNFSSASILNVVLPEELVRALESEAFFQAKKREQETEHAYYLKKLEDRQQLERKKTAAENECNTAIAKAEKECAQLRAHRSELSRLEQKRLAEIAAEERSAIREIEARGEAKTARFRAHSLRLRARAQGEAAPLLASMRAHRRELARFKVLAAIAHSGNLVVSGNGEHLLDARIPATTEAESAANVAFLKDHEKGRRQPKIRVS